MKPNVIDLAKQAEAARGAAEHEVRIFRLGEIRADATGDPVIEGKAAVYNAPSEDLGFVEVIEPGFFDDVLEDDVRGLFNHDANFVLGRRSAGTLELQDSPEALGVTIHPPKTQLVKDLVLEPMRRGDINQMSFAFFVKIDGDEWSTKEGKVHRVLKKGGCAALFDASVVTYPAYPQTSAQVRSKAQAMQSQDVSVQEQPPNAADRVDPAAEQARVAHANRRRRLQL